jgi:serine/threonine protein kinase
MPFAVDTQLGPYRIISLIGAGGMGEVYRAHDTRLLRDVGLKVLQESFTADPDRLRRFEQEAPAVAALNHPNIVSVFDVGVADKIHRMRFTKCRSAPANANCFGLSWFRMGAR